MTTNHNLCEEKGGPKRIRTHAPLLTSPKPYRCAKPAHKDQNHGPTSGMGIVRENAKIRDIETEFPRRKEKFIHGEKKLGVQKNNNKQTREHIF